ncbi:hypothetical protein SAMN05428969_3604 [Devosia sp. YR412]|uniref:hypothetical protein n=1 Tax=Devosia sp. YR412 TaxID=1881030 RepID=UPI0008D4B08C|nr:hypothetical protein [Devosia sp. YR412]SEQ58414.1 hypothetical protein SAMN05428969_3604 [Devosia sp. YR412]
MSDLASPEDQISQSRRVLAAWDWMSTISTRPDEVVRLLQGETRALASLAIEHPDNAPAAAQLIAAYGRLAARVKEQSHRGPGQAKQQLSA